MQGQLWNKEQEPVRWSDIGVKVVSEAVEKGCEHVGVKSSWKEVKCVGWSLGISQGTILLRIKQKTFSSLQATTRKTIH